MTFEGEKIEQKKPLELFIDQFAPTNVYYLLEVYFDRHSKDAPFYSSKF